MSDRSSTPILSPGAKCVEIGLLPDLAERVGRRARHMLVHPWRKPRPGRPVRERPCRADRPEQRRIAGLSPGGVLHVGHVPELVDGHHSPSRSSRRRSRSASARSRGLTVSTRLILPPEVSAIAHFDRPTAAAPQRISAGGSRALVRATRRTGPRRAGRRASRRHWPPPPIPFLPARRVVNRGHHGRQRTSRAFTVGRAPFRSQFAAVFLTLSAMRTGSPRTRRASSSSRSGTAGPVRHTPPVPNAGRSPRLSRSSTRVLSPGPGRTTLQEARSGRSSAGSFGIWVYRRRCPRRGRRLATTDSTDPVSVGTNLTYASQIKNNGRFDATTVTLIDVLRAGVTFISAAASQGACSDQSVIRTVRCELGAIANHGSASATVVVRPLQRTTVSRSGGRRCEPG